MFGSAFNSRMAAVAWFAVSGVFLLTSLVFRNHSLPQITAASRTMSSHNGAETNPVTSVQRVADRTWRVVLANADEWYDTRIPVVVHQNVQIASDRDLAIELNNTTHFWSPGSAPISYSCTEVGPGWMDTLKLKPSDLPGGGVARVTVRLEATVMYHHDLDMGQGSLDSDPVRRANANTEILTEVDALHRTDAIWGHF